MFSRDFRRPKRAKSKHIFEIKEEKQVLRWSAACLLGCPLVQAFEAQDLPDGWRWSSGRVFPAFCPLSCFALGALLANMPLFRVLRAFLEGFVGFVWVCVGCVLCVACGAFVRVWS